MRRKGRKNLTTKSLNVHRVGLYKAIIVAIYVTLIIHAKIVLDMEVIMVSMKNGYVKHVLIISLRKRRKQRKLAKNSLDVHHVSLCKA
jgi:hypothetical protein